MTQTTSVNDVRTCLIRFGTFFSCHRWGTWNSRTKCWRPSGTCCRGRPPPPLTSSPCWRLTSATCRDSWSASIMTSANSTWRAMSCTNMWRTTRQSKTFLVNGTEQLLLKVCELKWRLGHIVSDKICNLVSVGCFRYEGEINKRNDAENEFVLLKKVKYAVLMAIIDYRSLVRLSSEMFVPTLTTFTVLSALSPLITFNAKLRKVCSFFTYWPQDVDAGYLSKVDLDDRVFAVNEELNFLKALYDTVHYHSLKMLKISNQRQYIQYVSCLAFKTCFLLFLYVLF